MKRLCDPVTARPLSAIDTKPIAASIGGKLPADAALYQVAVDEQVEHLTTS